MFIACLVVMWLSCVHKHAFHFVVLMWCAKEVCKFCVLGVILASDVMNKCNEKRSNTF
jgi:hypothetical protein